MLMLSSHCSLPFTTTTKSRDCGAMNSGLSAEDLNNNYARISMDTNYQAPERKRSNNSRCVSKIHEITVFRMLEGGIDG